MNIRYRSNLTAGISAVVVSIVIFLIIPLEIGEDVQAVHGITSRTFPYVLSGLMGACGLGLIIQSLVFKKDEIKEIKLGQEVKGVLYIIVLLIYAFACRYSFVIATSLLGFATLRFEKCKKISYYLIIMSTVVIIYL